MAATTADLTLTLKVRGIKDATQQLKDLQKALEAVSAGTKALSNYTKNLDAIKSLAKIPQLDFSTSTQAVQSLLNQQSSLSNFANSALQHFRSIGSGVAEFLLAPFNLAKNAIGSVVSYGLQQLSRLASSAVRYAKTFVLEAINQYDSLEKTFSEVSATTGIVGKELEDLAKATRQAAIPLGSLTAESLAKIQVVAGTLNIPSDQILDFSKNVGIATIALTKFKGNTEDVAIRLAKAQEIFGDTAAQTANYASVLDWARRNTKANELEISNFLLGMGKVASQMQITADQATAWGGILVGSGMQARQAATSISSAFNFLTKNNKPLIEAQSLLEGNAEAIKQLEAVAGAPLDEFKSLAHLLRAAIGQDGSQAMAILANSLNAIEDNAKRNEIALKLFGSYGKTSMLLLAESMKPGIDGLSEFERVTKGASAAFQSGQEHLASYERAVSRSGEQFNIFKSILNDIQISIGGPLLRSIGELLKTDINPLLSDFADWLRQSDAVSTAFDALKNGIKTVGELAGDTISTIADITQEIAAFASESEVISFAMQEILSGEILTGTMDLIQGSFYELENLFAESPFLPLITSAETAFEAVRNISETAISTITTAIDQASQGDYTGAFSTLTQGIVESFGTITIAFEDIGNDAKMLLSTLQATFADTSFEPFVNLIGAAAADTITFLQGISEASRNVITELSDQKYESALDSLVNGVKTGVENITTFIDNLLENSKSIVTQFAASFEGTPLEPFVTEIGTAINNVIELLQSITNTANDVYQALVTPETVKASLGVSIAMLGTVAEGFNKAIQGLKDLGTALGEFASGEITLTDVGEAIKLLATDAVDALSTSIDSGYEKLKNLSAVSFSSLSEGLGNLEAIISGKMTAALTSLESSFQTTKETALTQFETIKSDLVGKFDGLKDDLSAKLNDIVLAGQEIIQEFLALWENITSQIAAKFDGIKSEIVAKFDGLVEALPEPVRKLLGLEGEIVPQVIDLNTIPAQSSIKQLRSAVLENYSVIQNQLGKEGALALQDEMNALTLNMVKAINELGAPTDIQISKFNEMITTLQRLGLIAYEQSVFPDMESAIFDNVDATSDLMAEMDSLTASISNLGIGASQVQQQIEAKEAAIQSTTGQIVALRNQMISADDIEAVWLKESIQELTTKRGVMQNELSILKEHAAIVQQQVNAEKQLFQGLSAEAQKYLFQSQDSLAVLKELGIATNDYLVLATEQARAEYERTQALEAGRKVIEAAAASVLRLSEATQQANSTFGGKTDIERYTLSLEELAQKGRQAAIQQKEFAATVKAIQAFDQANQWAERYAKSLERITEGQKIHAEAMGGLSDEAKHAILATGSAEAAYKQYGIQIDIATFKEWQHADAVAKKTEELEAQLTPLKKLQDELGKLSSSFSQLGDLFGVKELGGISTYIDKLAELTKIPSIFKDITTSFSKVSTLFSKAGDLGGFGNMLGGFGIDAGGLTSTLSGIFSGKGLGGITSSISGLLTGTNGLSAVFGSLATAGKTLIGSLGGIASALGPVGIAATAAVLAFGPLKDMLSGLFGDGKSVGNKAAEGWRNFVGDILEGSEELQNALGTQFEQMKQAGFDFTTYIEQQNLHVLHATTGGFQQWETMMSASLQSVQMGANAGATGLDRLAYAIGLATGEMSKGAQIALQQLGAWQQMGLSVEQIAMQMGELTAKSLGTNIALEQMRVIQEMLTNSTDLTSAEITALKEALASLESGANIPTIQQLTLNIDTLARTGQVSQLEIEKLRTSLLELGASASPYQLLLLQQQIESLTGASAQLDDELTGHSLVPSLQQLGLTAGNSQSPIVALASIMQMATGSSTALEEGLNRVKTLLLTTEEEGFTTNNMFAQVGTSVIDLSNKSLLLAEQLGIITGQLMGVSSEGEGTTDIFTKAAESATIFSSEIVDLDTSFKSVISQLTYTQWEGSQLQTTFMNAGSSALSFGFDLKQLSSDVKQTTLDFQNLRREIEELNAIGTITIRIESELQQFAKGGWASGLALVGERGWEIAKWNQFTWPVGLHGPELTVLPNQTYIVPHHRVQEYSKEFPSFAEGGRFEIPRYATPASQEGEVVLHAPVSISGNHFGKDFDEKKLSNLIVKRVKEQLGREISRYTSHHKSK